MSFAVDFNFDDFAREARAISEIAEKQLPFALAKTLTQTAKAAVGDVQSAMTREFDRPTRYTLNVFGIIPATKQKLQAEILPRSFAGKGNIAWKYLETERGGGLRRPKGAEKAFRNKFNQPIYYLPAKNLPLNSYGNVSGGLMQKILSGIEAQGDWHQNSTVRSAKKKKLLAAKGGLNNTKRIITNSPYIVGRKKTGGLPYGIFELVDTSDGVKRQARIKPVLYLRKNPPKYKPRFNFAAAIDKSVRATMPALFTRNLTDAIATAHR